MGDRKNLEEKSNFTKINIKSELSSLVDKNIIPEKVAIKLEEKLVERNVQLTKEQLHFLVNKIMNLIKSYGKNGEKYQTFNDNKDMATLFNTIEKLEKRISKIESNETFPQDSSWNQNEINESNFVTTEEIKLPGKNWKVEPLLKIPNDPESIIILMKWLQYLIDKCGRESLSNILDYYVDIGWVSEDAKISLLDYSHGITEEKKGTETIKKDIRDLPSKDHIQSLIYIHKLKGKHFDKHFIDRIDGELNRITKKLDNYHMK